MYFMLWLSLWMTITHKQQALVRGSTRNDVFTLTIIGNWINMCNYKCATNLTTI